MAAQIQPNPLLAAMRHVWTRPESEDDSQAKRDMRADYKKNKSAFIKRLEDMEQKYETSRSFAMKNRKEHGTATGQRSRKKVPTPDEETVTPSKALALVEKLLDDILGKKP